MRLFRGLKLLWTLPIFLSPSCMSRLLSTSQIPSHEGFSPLYRNVYLYLITFHKLSHNTFTMPNASPLSHLLKDIDIEAEASRFTVIMNHMLNHSTTSTIPAPRTQVPRKPQKKNQIIPSSFCPHVLTSERLQQWTSPHSLDFHQSIQHALP